MKTTLLLSACLLSISQAFCQLENVDPNARSMTVLELPSQTERYGVDYELKDYTFVNGDSTVLEMLNLSVLEESRSEDHDVEVIDPSTGLVVILFYEKRSFSISPNNLNQQQ
jgi:hypothetical protein